MKFTDQTGHVEISSKMGRWKLRQFQTPIHDCSQKRCPTWLTFMNFPMENSKSGKGKQSFSAMNFTSLRGNIFVDERTFQIFLDRPSSQWTYVSPTLSGRPFMSAHLTFGAYASRSLAAITRSPPRRRDSSELARHGCDIVIAIVASPGYNRHDHERHRHADGRRYGSQSTPEGDGGPATAGVMRSLTRTTSLGRHRRLCCFEMESVP